jgi:hypothetical protein
VQIVSFFLEGVLAPMKLENVAGIRQCFSILWAGMMMGIMNFTAMNHPQL